MSTTPTTDRFAEDYEDLGIPCLKSWLERAVISPFRTAESLIPDDKSLIKIFQLFCYQLSILFFFDVCLVRVQSLF